LIAGTVALFTLRHRKVFVEVDDRCEYRRCRVQLRARGIVLRDVVAGSAIKTKRQQLCRAGDFLVAEIDAKVGGFGIVPRDLDGAIVSSHYFLFEVDPTVLDRRYLGYYVRTTEFSDQVTAQGSTNYAAVRPQQVLNYRMPLPPFPEQRCIVNHLDLIEQALDEIRVLQEQATRGGDAFQ
jgi:type I restriction enzyme, S subunit